MTYASGTMLEGHLFPDTYEFPLHANAKDVVAVMTENFDVHAAPILEKDPARKEENIIIASMLEKEVTSEEDRRIVAGIIKKRLKSGMPLQIDATICYAKRMRAPLNKDFACYPLTSLDFAVKSPYNTYLQRGLPPGPIGSPGVDALQAALDPKDTPYLYYLSDPASRRTIFSATGDEQASNRERYLKL